MLARIGTLKCFWQWSYQITMKPFKGLSNLSLLHEAVVLRRMPVARANFLAAVVPTVSTPEWICVPFATWRRSPYFLLCIQKQYVPFCHKQNMSYWSLKQQHPHCFLLPWDWHNWGVPPVHFHHQLCSNTFYVQLIRRDQSKLVCDCIILLI